MERSVKFFIYALFTVVIFYALSFYAFAAVSTSQMAVCDHSAESLLGFGEAKVWSFYWSCDNVPDGICPEDYTDAFNMTIAGNCSSCIDPDCTGTLMGHVYDYRGVPIDKAIVTSHPTKYNLSAPSMETTTLTNFDGSYSFQVATGKYYFSASKDSYDTELKEATVIRGGAAVLDFNLQNGTCHDDCTNSYGRCNAQCNGMNFENGTKNCTFYDIKAMNLCNNRLKGTTILYNLTNDTTAEFVDCCASPPEERYYTRANVDSTKIKDLVKIEKIAKYNDVPVRVMVAYWAPVES